MDQERRLSLDDAVEFNPTHHFRWEEAQQAHVLLYPEGIVKLNETAAAILETSTARLSIGEAATELAARYRRNDLHAEILKFLEVAHAKGWIRIKS
jgi:pyrroloquinoline quinone biosynthesis protein D